MPAPRQHPEETRRLAALHALDILDSEREERFDRLTRLAQRVFKTQAAQVNLIDEQRVWFKSSLGFPGEEAERSTSFCGHAILQSQTMVVADATRDQRFADNPFVLGDPNIRFYAGHPITAPGGEPVGTLCVFDDSPRDVASFDEETLRELAAMAEAEIAALSLAIGDELTGLSNRRGFEMLGERLLEAARRVGLPVTAIYADLDNMKPINDRFGHDAGDRALIETAAILSAVLRHSDLLARLGGDEFCAVLAGAEAREAAVAAGRIEEALQQRNAASEEPFELAISVGLVEADPGTQINLWDLTAAADAAMLAAKRAKKAGRNGAETASGVES
ncbi:MAG TPA: sensor domain-containing diguanylate cyclase [Solirubrobacterales bacterium]|nr:sensor domain-containing diguanylate cyclase [Solirubrobacterales bacterium]